MDLTTSAAAEERRSGPVSSLIGIQSIAPASGGNNNDTPLRAPCDQDVQPGPMPKELNDLAGGWGVEVLRPGRGPVTETEEARACWSWHVEV